MGVQQGGWHAQNLLCQSSKALNTKARCQAHRLWHGQKWEAAPAAAASLLNARRAREQPAALISSVCELVKVSLSSPRDVRSCI